MTRVGFRLAILLITAGMAAGAIRPDFSPQAGAQLDLATPLTDAFDVTAPLGAFMAGKPALILFGYHRCPNLCGVAQLELARAITATGLPSDSYSVLFASIDPEETSADARAARDKLAEADTSANLAAWHFLTGGQQNLERLERSVGLTVDRREGSDFYIHAVAASVFTPDGRLSRIFPGLDYASRDIRLALIEASQGKLGTLGDHILLLCSGFNAATGRYTGEILLGLKAACLAVLLLLASLLFRLERSRRA